MPLRRLLTPTATRSPRSIERDHVTLDLADGRQVQVLRVRDPRAKRIRLSVDERGARLTLPSRASLISGTRFLEEHRGWLVGQLAQIERHAGKLPALRVGVPGALPLRGQSLPLRWQAGRSRQLLQDDAGLVFQVLAPDLPATGTAAAGWGEVVSIGLADAQAAPPLPPALRRTLRDFYLAQARADVGRWLPAYLPGLPRPPLRIGFKSMRSQWGSLSAKGVMALDLSLILAPPDAFRYVLVHELCHLIHHDHSPAFWKAVGERFSDWQGQHDWFQSEGRGLKATLRRLLEEPSPHAPT